MTDIDADVIRYLELGEQIEALQMQQAQIKARLRDLGPGKHEAVGGVVVQVTPPPRSFNLDRAWTMLTEEQRAAAVAPDPKKVKQQLPEVLIDACMDPGNGEARVTVR